LGASNLVLENLGVITSWLKSGTKNGRLSSLVAESSKLYGTTLKLSSGSNSSTSPERHERVPDRSVEIPDWHSLCRDYWMRLLKVVWPCLDSKISYNPVSLQSFVRLLATRCHPWPSRGDLSSIVVHTQPYVHSVGMFVT